MCTAHAKIIKIITTRLDSRAPAPHSAAVVTKVIWHEIARAFLSHVHQPAASAAGGVAQVCDCVVTPLSRGARNPPHSQRSICCGLKVMSLRRIRVPSSTQMNTVLDEAKTLAADVANARSTACRVFEFRRQARFHSGRRAGNLACRAGRSLLVLLE